MGSPQGSTAKRSGPTEITCVGGRPKWKGAAAFSDGSQLRGLVGGDLEMKNNRVQGAPTPMVSTGLDE